MADENDNKVVPFPTHKVKKPKGAGAETLGQPGDQPTLGHKRTTFIVSLLATVMLATYLSDQSNTGGTGGRMPASSERPRRELGEEIALARKISRDSLRGPASRGREPTAEDILRDGLELRGLYALGFNDAGSLRKLEFRDEPGQERDIVDRSKFLLDVRDLIRIDFDRAKIEEAIDSGLPASGSKRDDHRFEVYDLKQGDKVQARAHFELLGNALIKMTIETNP